MHHPFFQQHIPRFIAASYKEEHINIDKKFKLSGNTYFYQNLQIIKKRVSYADSAFSKTKKNLSNFSLLADRTISKSDAS